MSTSLATQQLAFPQPPYASPITDQNGLLTDPWNKWFQQLYLRIGGALSAPIPNLNSIPLSPLISSPVLSSINTLYTSPVGVRTVINSFQVQNLDHAPHAISVWFVQQGLTAGATNIVANQVSIPALSTITLPNLQFAVINGAGTIQAQASVPGVLNIIANGRFSP